MANINAATSGTLNRLRLDTSDLLDATVSGLANATTYAISKPFNETDVVKDNKEFMRKIVNAGIIVSAVVGTTETRRSDAMAKSYDFKNDTYLHEIGLGYGSTKENKELQSFESKTYASVTNNAMATTRSATIGGTFQANISKDNMTNSQLEQIRKTGVVSFDGAYYKARIDKSGDVNVWSSQKVFSNTGAVQIIRDEKNNTTTYQSNVDISSLTSKELSSKKDSDGNFKFTRNGVDYVGRVGNNGTQVLVTATSNGSNDGKIRSAFNTPFQTNEVKASMSQLKSKQLDDVLNNCMTTIKAGGVTYNATVSQSDRDNYKTKIAKASASERMNMDKSIHGTQARRMDDVIRVRQAGLSYIQQRGGICKDFDGTTLGVNSTKIKLKAEQKDINNKLNKMRSAGVSSNDKVYKDLQKKLAESQHNLDLVKQYESHGGTISRNYNRYNNARRSNPRYRAFQLAATTVVGEDINRGMQFTKNAVRMTKTGVRAVTGVTRGINYLGASAANRIVAGSASFMSGTRKNAITKRLDDRQQTRTTRYGKKKDRARDKMFSERSHNMRGYYQRRREERKFERIDRTNSKLKKIEKREVFLNGTTGSGIGRKFNNSKLGAKVNPGLRRLNDVNRRFVNGKLTLGTRVNRFRHDFTYRLKNNRITNSKLVRGIKSVKKFNNKVVTVLFKPISIAKDIKNLIQAKIKKIIGSIVLGYISIFLGFVACCYAGYMFSMFWSQALDTINRLVNTSIKDQVEAGMNFQQMIVDVVADDITQDFEMICKLDATYHYMNKRQLVTIKSPDAEKGLSETDVIESRNSGYPWFANVNLGSIGHIWPWEESDDISRFLTEGDADSDSYDDYGRLVGSGEYMYKDTYVLQDQRVELDSNTFNLYPIVAMSRMRYWDEIGFETWETVLGYTYYMYAVSHDVAKYDSNQTAYTQRYLQYKDAEEDPGYDYTLKICGNGALYNGGVSYSGADHTISRGTELCTNIYIHDFSPSTYSYDDDSHSKHSTLGNVPDYYYGHNVNNSSRHDLPSMSQANLNGGTSLLSSLTNFISSISASAGRNLRGIISSIANKIIHGETDIVSSYADTFDRGYTDVNAALILSLRRYGLKGISVNTEWDQIYDVGSRQNLLVVPIEGLSSSNAFNTDGKNMLSSLVDIEKNKSGIFPYDGTEESLPHAQEHPAEFFGSGDEDSNYTDISFFGLGEACDNVLFAAYGDTVSLSYGGLGSESYNEYNEDSAFNRIEDLDLSEIELSTGACHEHTLECCKLACGMTTESVEYTKINEKTGEEEEVYHTHSISCVDPHTIATEEEDGWPGCPIKHHHEPWKGPDSPGCWKTISICGGHCGNHLTPYVNIVAKVTYEGLADDDNFKTTYWLTVEEIAHVGGGKYGLTAAIDNLIKDNIVTVAQFRTYWYAKCNTWFSPIPRSTYGFFKKVGERYMATCLNIIDGVNAFVRGIIKTANKEGNLVENTKDAWEMLHGSNDSEEDMWDWEGWWEDEQTIDPSLLDHMATHYGNWEEDKYEISKDLWDPLTTGEASVAFPKYGINRDTYPPEQIEQIIEEIENIPGLENLTPAQKAIIEAGLKRCGTFGYKFGARTGYSKNSGLSDCSAWVSGTLREAGFDIGDNTTAGLASRSTRWTSISQLSPGTVITRYGTSKSNHTMIFVGKLDLGKGPEYYVMDCSSSVGGSSLRPVSPAYLRQYSYMYNAF